MSKPVSNNQVEDVLSSIRRLVSDDKRPLQAAKTAEASSRLVLTPALRVGQDKQADGSQRREAASEQAEEGSIKLYDTYSNDEDRHGSEHATEHDSDEQSHANDVIPATWKDDDLTEDHTSDAFWDDEPGGEDGQDLEALVETEEGEEDTKPDFNVEAESQDELTAAHMSENPTDDEAFVADAAEREDASVAKSAAALTAKIAALETAVGSFRQEWEPDDPGADAFSGTGGPILNWEDNVELDAHGKPVLTETPLDDDADADEIEEIAFDGEGEDNPSGPEMAQEKTRFADAEIEKEHPTEASVFRHRVREYADDMDREFEEQPPEDGAADARNGDRLADISAQEDEPIFASAQPRDLPEETIKDPESFSDGAGFALEDTVLDEDALRDLVSDIVRSELQGALGERITRNVRKLVRREIHRALAAQELD